MPPKPNGNNPLPPGTRVLAYARDSGGAQQERSVDQQIAEIAAYCQAHAQSAAALDLARLEAEIGGLDRAIANLLNSLEAGASVGARLAGREAERAAKREQLTRLAASVPAPLDPAALPEIVERLQAAVEAGDANAGRAALGQLLVSATVTPPNELAYTWR